MPNRTIYLPDDLDQVSRQLGLNLSKVTQEAIAAAAADRSDEVLEQRVEQAEARIAELGLSWPDDALAAGRAEADER